MSDISNIDAAILAGGLGTRLRSVVPDRPKVLAEIGGRPFIEILLDQVAAAGIRTAVLCTGYLGDQIEARLGTRRGPLALRYSREVEPLGTGGALRLALPMLASDTVLVLNGDSYCDADLRALSRSHADHEARASMLLVHVDDARRFGRVVVDEAGWIVAFREKSDDSSPALINAGIYVLQRGVLEALDDGRAISLEHDVFPRLVGRGLYGCRSNGRLWDIGIPEAYDEARSELPARVAQ